jgi:hypothetical protein
VRVDTSSLDIADLKGEMPPRREPGPAPEPNRKRRTDQKLGSKKKPKIGKLLKELRNIGGADGTRSPISNLLILKTPRFPAIP